MIDLSKKKIKRRQYDTELGQACYTTDYINLIFNEIKSQGLVLADDNGGTGIIYCFRRVDCEEMAELLSSLGLSAAAYHAGLSSQLRNNVQE